MATGDVTVGRYRLLRLLGRGGMGEVHLASAHGAAGFTKLVALKILRDVHEEDDERRRSLWREALLGARLDHEGVVQVLDLGEEADRYYVAFEYVRGFPLGQVLDHLEGRGETYDLRSAVHVTRAVADTLVYVHGRAGADGEPLGLMHGDVSPSNVLLAADGRVKLSDFGLAVFEEEEQAYRGKVAGKLAYLPPEAFAGEPRTQAWDVYALALTLYRAIAGHTAYRGEGLGEIQEALARGVPPLAELRPDCPRELAAVVERAIDRKGSRYRRARDFRRALDEAFPRRVDDGEHHARFISEIYGRAGFVQEHGELPATGSSSNVSAAVVDESERRVLARARQKPLRFGISPAHGPRVARARGARLAELLGERLGREVRVVPFADYGALEDCLVQGEVDFAWTPPAAFVAAAERGVGLVAVAQRRGRPSFDSALAVRSDAGYAELGDLRGGAVAWVDRESASGYLFVAAELSRRVGSPGDFFAREHFHGSHRAACEAVVNGWADAAATYVVRGDDGAIVHAGWSELLDDESGIQPLLFAGPIPGDNIAHRPHLPGKLLDRLIGVWTELSADDEGRAALDEIFHAEAFVPADLELYERMREALRILGSTDGSGDVVHSGE